jgi:hypothetical protein
MPVISAPLSLFVFDCCASYTIIWFLLLAILCTKLSTRRIERASLMLSRLVNDCNLYQRLCLVDENATGNEEETSICTDVLFQLSILAGC